MSTATQSPSLLLSWPSTDLTLVIRFLGLSDARLSPSDWSFERNPFWTTFLLTVIVLPCLFYITWYLNPSLSKNRLGLSWVMGFYSAILFTLAGLYEVPNLRTIFNSVVDYHPVASTAVGSASVPSLQSIETLTLMSALTSFVRLESDSYAKYYCFSDFSSKNKGQSHFALNTTTESLRRKPFGPINLPHFDTTTATPCKALEENILSLRHRMYQRQMRRPHLFFSLENYPDDTRIGPQIIAANFQAFLVIDLILGLIHYRKQLEPLSTVMHHIIYYFIVVHMRAADMLSVFCICGTPIEASSIFLAFGRIFPHRRTPTIERLYLACFISTRLIYVALLWHEIYFNYPDKTVSFLYTITISLHIYWFVLYIKTQRRFRAKQRRQQLPIS